MKCDSILVALMIMDPLAEHLFQFWFITPPQPFRLHTIFFLFKHFPAFSSFHKSFPRPSRLSFCASYRSNSLGAEVSVNATAVRGGVGGGVYVYGVVCMIWGCFGALGWATRGVVRNQKTVSHSRVEISIAIFRVIEAASLNPRRAKMIFIW